MNHDALEVPALEALLFDVDGTLADTEETHRLAFNAAFSGAGLDWYWDEALYEELLLVTGGRERIRFFLDRYAPSFRPAGDLDATIAGLHRDKTRIYVQMLSKGEIPLRPGVERLIREARAQGLRLAIATTTTPENVYSLLEHSFSTNAAGWFELIAAADAAPNKKPAPDVYLYALQRLGLPAERCLAIEDSANGLISARQAGVDVLITVNGYTRDQDFSGAAVVLDGLGEPGHPCRRIAGGPEPDGMVVSAYLRRVHAAAWKARRAAPGTGTVG
ncbi:MAG: HAD family hydrolase [Gammaproteobacteria bacterium]